MQPTVKLSGVDHTVKILKDITDLEKLQVYVGIPEAKASRRKGKVNNAELAYIHTHGSPLRNIPPRPIIEPAIEATGNKEAIADELKEAGKASLDGNKSQAVVHLKRAGQTGENAARNWFTDPRNRWPKNAPSTIRRKGSDRPLIDTGELRKSITHVLAEE